MDRAKYPPIFVLYWLTFALAIAYLAWEYPRLPDTVASHFNSRGQADGWSPKNIYVGFLAIVYCLMAGLFWVVQSTMRRFPVKLLNVPNRAFWLAPEREAATRERLARSGLWLGWATLMLLMGVTYLSLRANAVPERSMGLTPWFLLAVYVGFSGWWLGRLLYGFMRAPVATQTPV